MVRVCTVVLVEQTGLPVPAGQVLPTVDDWAVLISTVFPASARSTVTE